MQSFMFSINEEVVIAASGEKGRVIGRAEYLSSANSYLLRYARADGCAVEQWWNEDALRCAN